MDRTVARICYNRQKSGAKRRGISWEFNFQTWLDWWGADIERRGIGPNDLQMQRFADTGPYAAWNVRKGTPKDNAKTRGHMQRKRNTEAAKAAIESARGASEPTACKDWMEDDEHELNKMFGVRSSAVFSGHFKRDKHRY